MHACVRACVLTSGLYLLHPVNLPDLLGLNDLSGRLSAARCRGALVTCGIILYDDCSHRHAALRIAQSYSECSCWLVCSASSCPPFDPPPHSLPCA